MKDQINIQKYENSYQFKPVLSKGLTRWLIFMDFYFQNHNWIYKDKDKGLFQVKTMPFVGLGSTDN